MLSSLTFGLNVTFGTHVLALADRAVTFQGLTGSSNAASQLLRTDPGALCIELNGPVPACSPSSNAPHRKSPPPASPPGTGPNAGFQVMALTGTGIPGAPHVLEHSTGLVIWTPLQTITSPAGAWSSNVGTPISLARLFIRVRQE